MVRFLGLRTPALDWGLANYSSHMFLSIKLYWNLDRIIHLCAKCQELNIGPEIIWPLNPELFITAL